jgi:hypothetical protein
VNVFAIVLLAASFLGPGRNYGATPEAAARATFGAPPGKRIVIVRENVVGRFATVLMPAAIIEGSPASAPILFERFAFGWQAIESLNFRCRLDGHGISPAAQVALLAGMPKPSDETACETGWNGDAGPREDILTIRLRENRLLIPSVRVVGDHALAEWYGGGGGEHVYRREGRAWHLIAGGGGAMGVADMIALGVPRAAMCPLGIYDAHCSKR